MVWSYGLAGFNGLVSSGLVWPGLVWSDDRKIVSKLAQAKIYKRAVAAGCSSCELFTELQNESSGYVSVKKFTSVFYLKRFCNSFQKM